MSPRNCVASLRYMCLKIIYNQVIHALSDEEGKHYEVVKKYLLGATCEVLQDLLNSVLNSVNLDASIRFSCLELLLRTDVKKLETGMFPQFYYEKILYAIIVRGKHLEHLNLKGCWVRDYPKLLSEVIRSCKCLKVLIIPHMANDEVLDAIQDLNKLLVLNINGEVSFSVQGIKNFESNILTVLDIGNFGKSDICEDETSGPELIADMLTNLPNIQHLKTYSFTGKALVHFSERKLNRKTKLKYLHDTGTSLGIMNCIVELCPDLENVHFDSPDEGVIIKMSEICKLQMLKLTRGNISELLKFLRHSGSRIHALILNSSKRSTLDLSELCLLVPNLVTLECFKMSLTFSNLENYFICLETVQLLHCDMLDNVVKCLSTNVPFLKRFIVGSVINMTDGDVFRICAESELSCLEELWFSYARCLTSITVELLMGHCPNLKVIGQLDRWDITQDDLDMLRIVIALTNTDLSLLPE